MSRRKRLAFIFMLVVTIITTLAIVVPGAAHAQIVAETVTWSGAVTTNEYDPFYDRTVIAYTEGATATVSFAYFNGMGMWVTARPYIDMDWGQRYYGATVNIAPFQAATMSISFTVPSGATTGGAINHGYFINVQGEQQGYPSIVNRQVGELWYGDGTDTYDLGGSDFQVVEGSVQVWTSSDGVAWTAVAPTAYDVDEWNGEVDFNATPAIGDQYLFTYDYYADLGAGDGDSKVFTVVPPMGAELKEGTLQVFLTNNTDTTVNQRTTGWTYSSKTGLLVFDSPPTPNQNILVRFEYWQQLPGSWASADDGRTFVIFSADQAAAITSWRRYMETMETADVDGWISAEAQQLWAQAEAARAKGEIEYREGQFAASNASMQAALTALNGSIAAAVDFMKNAQEMHDAFEQAELQAYQADAAYDNAQVARLQAEIANIPKDGAYLDSQTAYYNALANNLNKTADGEKALLEAEAKQAKGEAAMYGNIGIFMIIVAVAMLLLAIGFILWAFSRLTEAKRPGQQP